MQDLAQIFMECISAGLKRKTLTSCSRWASEYRVMGQPYPGKWNFDHHPWLRDMHDSNYELNVGQKSAQMGFTEAVLNIVFFNIDVKGVDCLYVLPAQTPDASDFSAARFDPALEMSPHLEKMFSDVKNVGHKRAGNSNLYIRGSRSRSGLKSVPTGLIILDELDEMTQENVPLAMERAAGQVDKQIWMVSTATIENFGINFYYRQSTQNHFFFVCPGCSRHIELQFPESLVITGDDLQDPNLKQSYLQCSDCKIKLPHETKHEWQKRNEWVPSFTNRDSAGWHINQMYSSTMTPYAIAKSYLTGLLDPSAEQEFYNSKLGLPHAVKGAKVTDDEIESAKRGYHNGQITSGNFLTLGVDVGTYLHYVINEWFLPNQIGNGADINILSKARTLKFGKLKNFEDLDEIMMNYQINFCVIDANPERRKATEFANRFPGRVRLCFYGRGVQGKTIHVHEAEPTITVDRTSWLDMSLGRFRRNEGIVIPFDVDMEYRAQIKALVRVYSKDVDGNPIGRYEKGNEDDHYAHANNYAEIALPLGSGTGVTKSIQSPI